MEIQTVGLTQVTLVSLRVASVVRAVRCPYTVTGEVDAVSCQVNCSTFVYLSILGAPKKVLRAI